MNNPDQPHIFQSPTTPIVEEHAKPTVDGSDEARRRMRNPFETSRPQEEPEGTDGGDQRTPDQS